MMKCWFIFILPVISTLCTAILRYVLPDNVCDVDCPSQPCATLVSRGQTLFLGIARAEGALKKGLEN